ESLEMTIHATTSHWNKTLYDPYVNVLRTTTETMAAAIAGADVISVGPFDQTFTSPDDFSMRIARNQQIILQEESYLGKIIDPGAGSYYIEKLTDALAARAWELFRQAEEKGGFVESMKLGLIQDEVERTRLQKETDIVGRKTFVLGTNQYPNQEEKMAGKISRTGTTPQIHSFCRPLIISRGSEKLENIRLATEKHVLSGNKTPDVFLFTIGNLAMRKARASFSSNFFGCAGYHIIDNTGFSGVEEGIQACLEVSPGIVVICSSDEEYPDLVPAICQGLKTAGFSGVIVLAGYPKDILDHLRSAGIDEFIHVRTNLVEALTRFHKKLDIPLI
ncbi:MAG: methylmalonyl-CoA mutase family protein, partial [Bacteroidetes bacterium]|nr:methylmalonyl-CoA mutase family protein [Bacteroidota bacterium]